MYTEDSIFDVVIGNMMGAWEVKNSDPIWIPQLAQAAVTGAQIKRNKDDIKPLNVSQSGIP